MRAPRVVKIGGRALEHPGAARELAAGIARMPGPLVLVHGGGAEVSAWCDRLGLEPRFLDGLRVTDAPTLEVAAAVLAGLANKRLVAVLRAAGVDAVGLSALDGGIAEASLHPDAERLGEVGRIETISPALIETLLHQGRVPVLASVAALGGRLLNVNADDLAAAIAGALRAQVLVLLSDTPGLRVAGELIERLSIPALEAALAHPEVRDGMVPKLAAARAALQAGVARVHIAAWAGPETLDELDSPSPPGTTIEAVPAEVPHA
ncbi:MAG TPA: acetylglutamate kinase [Candidatus Eisenbacteria bacterium]